ncbi:MAG TPA: glycosyltransferase [Bryobacteraceae bacterium]|nr:glycosyltransferase [Bryobacteraceae bacterium]
MNRTVEARSGDIAETASPIPAETVRLAVIVPAYRPQESLLQLIGALSEKPIPAIVVVDDGSGPEYREIFRRAGQFPKVRLVRHAVNLGKGAALKTGINYALCAFPGLQGVVTADADGQHHPDDIEQVAGQLAEEPNRVILGTRTFTADVPLRSRVGNAITRTVLRAVVGENISDTQTGLRGIPTRLLPHLLRLEANGYDFELDMLIAVREQAIPIAEVSIRTIYEPGNRTSHFNPLIDSMKIYFVLLRFSSVSLLTAALDTLVFYLAYRRLGNVAASQALGRLAAVAFNYSMVRRAVFFSKLRHAAVLPQYLLLVCVSGAASYAGIELLISRFHVQLLPAKLLVETALFFANFAIQRDFIFGKSPAGASRQRWIDNLPSWIPRAVLAALAITLLGVVWHGFRADRLLLGNAGWSPVGRYRLIHYTKIFWTASLAILLIVPSAFAPIAAILAGVATAIAIGPLAMLAVAAFLVASCALGSKLLGSSGDSSAENQLCATLLGIAVYIFLMTFLARLPVNYPAAYVALLAIPVLIDLRGVGRRLAWWGSSLVRSRPRPRPQVAAFALLVFVLGMHWLIVPQPESSADGLAMHLAIPVNISLHHVFTYLPGHILWSVMPMGGDWCYTMVYLLGGEFAARLLNFAMLLLVEALLYRAARRFVSPAIGFVILALFASTSLVQLVTGSLFIENFLAAMVLGMATALWRFGDTGQRRYLYTAAVLGGTALATKLGGMAYVAAVLPVAAIEVHRQWERLGSRPARCSGIAAALLLAAALPTYAISWWMTRDPIYPFLNAQFPSPLVDRAARFVDTNYTQPIAFRTPYDLTFHSHRYCEGRPGYLGFQGLLLVPLGLVALLAAGRRPAVSAAVVSIGGALIVLTFLANARYLYPSLPLMLVPLAALLGWLAPGALRRAFLALAVACVLLNTWFLPASNSYHSDFYEQAPLSRSMRGVYIHKNAPIREVGQYMNRTHPGAPVFLADGSALSAFNAEVYANDWHEYNVLARIWAARDPLEIAGILDRWNVHYVVAPKPDVGINLETSVRPPVLRALLDKCVTPEFQTAWLYLARVETDCQRKPSLVQPGIYDDFDLAILFNGPWIKDKSWPQTHAHTVTYSNVPGSEIRIAFQGGLLTYVYTKATNRGKADILIDGVHRATLDLYSPETEWQSRATFKEAAGQHLAVITILPDKNPKSSDRFIDVDAFEVQ